MHEEEFNRLLPVEFLRLVRAWIAQETRTDQRVARLCLTIASMHGATTEDGEKVTLQTFMPSSKKKPRRRKRGYNSQELLQQFLSASAYLTIKKG